jgi:hypothetical protein
MINYYFIIDTNSYSGNFNRELGTFITGWDPHCINEKIQKEFQEKFPEMDWEFDELIEPISGDHGDEVGTLYQASGRGSYNSVKLNLVKPASEALNFLKERAYAFPREAVSYCGTTFNDVKILGCRLLTETVTDSFEDV